MFPISITATSFDVDGSVLHRKKDCSFGLPTTEDDLDLKDYSTPASDLRIV